MSDEQQATATTGGYGYQSDEVKVSPFNFGLNAGNCKLTKFEWIGNGGKDGAEQEALDIVFNINGTDKNYRMFPVVKAFNKEQQEITDPNAPEFKDAVADFNSRIVHILHAFLDDATVKSTLSRPIASFKEFCQLVMGMLPKNYAEVPLDIFLQFQWNLGDKERTYLEIPGKMKYGKWLCKAVPGTWTKKTNSDESAREALWYENEKGEKHPFIKNGWFMASNFAHQQTSNTAEQSTNAAVATAMDGEKKAASW